MSSQVTVRRTCVELEIEESDSSLYSVSKILPRGVALISRRTGDDGRRTLLVRIPRRRGESDAQALQQGEALVETIAEVSRWWDVDRAPFPNPGTRAMYYLVSMDSPAGHALIATINAIFERDIADAHKQCTTTIIPAIPGVHAFYDYYRKLERRIARRMKLTQVARKALAGDLEEALQLAREFNFV